MVKQHHGPAHPFRELGDYDSDMNESDYWGSLEFRVCRELAGMPDNSLRFLWCDGFISQQYHLADCCSPCITGLAWICQGTKQEQWEFRLLLDQPAASRSEINWPLLLPPENATSWLAIDLAGKCIEIEPAVASTDAGMIENRY